MSKKLPKIIKDVGFDFDWEVEKVWRIDSLVEEIDISELEWHFKIPFWSTNAGYYDLTPEEVLNDPKKFKNHSKRIDNADLKHPLDIMFWKGRWVLLDGLHRLAKLKKEGVRKIKVRKIDTKFVPLIKK